jgi:hypothetical protein
MFLAPQQFPENQPDRVPASTRHIALAEASEVQWIADPHFKNLVKMHGYSRKAKI